MVWNNSQGAKNEKKQTEKQMLMQKIVSFYEIRFQKLLIWKAKILKKGHFSLGRMHRVVGRSVGPRIVFLIRCCHFFIAFGWKMGLQGRILGAILDPKTVQIDAKINAEKTSKKYDKIIPKLWKNESKIDGKSKHLLED